MTTLACFSHKSGWQNSGFTERFIGLYTCLGLTAFWYFKSCKEVWYTAKITRFTKRQFKSISRWNTQNWHNFPEIWGWIGTDKTTIQTLQVKSSLVSSPAICLISYRFIITYMFVLVCFFQRYITMARIISMEELLYVYIVKEESTRVPVVVRTLTFTKSTVPLETEFTVLLHPKTYVSATLLGSNILHKVTLWTQVFGVEKLFSNSTRNKMWKMPNKHWHHG